MTLQAGSMRAFLIRDRKSLSSTLRSERVRRGFLCLLVAVLCTMSFAQPASGPLELTRTVRTWEFLPVVGSRAGLFGNENGRFEAWVYPLKILRDLHLVFHVGDRALPAESLARTLTVRPESASIRYAGDSFRVSETLFVPVDEAGAVILLDIETEQPLEVEAAFTGDFQLEWPAALGGTFLQWDQDLKAFAFGEEARKFAALFGSPTASSARLSYQTNYSASDENSLRLGVTSRGKDAKVLVLAASVNGAGEAEKTYRHLVSAYAELQRASAEFYQKYLASTVSLELPDRSLQQAYDWARISTIQGLVNNPYLGTGLLAGYRTSGSGQRPGFAWFFGRDSLWTSFALNAEGDYSTTRTALDFISKYQRDDGKVPHEISQSASLVPWFKDYPYPYVSADATPLFVIAMNDYAVQSGDLAFVREKWDNIWRAYQFFHSTYDANGFAQNAGVGHGWVEGGPLLPVKNEFYHAGLAVAALQAMANLAKLMEKNDVAEKAAAEFSQKRPALEQAYWSPEKSIYAFALTRDNQRAEEASVLATVPMWFGLTDPGHSDQMISQLSEADHETDWGMRIISSQSRNYDGSGYHYGSVWPLFTGWASVGEYRYHRDLPAYSNLRANALLATDGSLGHFSEVLSGDYYQSFSTSSPHQIWSAAMVVSPILRGLFGLQLDTQSHLIRLAPHTPADWSSFDIRNVRLQNTGTDLSCQRTVGSIVLRIKHSGAGANLEFSPAISLRTSVATVTLNGRPAEYKVEPNSNDQHVVVRVPLREGSSEIVIRLQKDFGISLANDLPPLGSASSSLRIISQSWNATHNQLTVNVSGRTGSDYELGVWNPAEITSVEGAQMGADYRLHIRMTGEPSENYQRQRIVIHFGKP